MFEYKEQRQGLMLDSNGKKHPVLDPNGKPLFWERIFGGVCISSFANLDIWGCLLDKIAEMRRVSEAYSDKTHSEKDLAADYAFAFRRLRFHLSQITKRPIESQDAYQN